MIADLFLRIEELEKENKELKEEIEKLKQPDGLELAMREEWEKYENVLRQNWQRDLSHLIKRIKASEEAWIMINEVKRNKYKELLVKIRHLESKERYRIMDAKL